MRACMHTCKNASILLPGLFLFTAYVCVHIFKLTYLYTRTLVNYSHTCLLCQHIRPKNWCISFPAPLCFFLSHLWVVAALPLHMHSFAAFALAPSGRATWLLCVSELCVRCVASGAKAQICCMQHVFACVAQ